MASSEEDENKPLIFFDTIKKELFHPNSGFRLLHRRLKTHYAVEVNKDDINPETLAKAQCHVFGGPREAFEKREIDALHMYVRGGGNLVFMLTEGGDQKLNTNLNALFKTWGIQSRSDAVVRTVFFRYFHPKEVCVTHGIVNRAIDQAAGKNISGEIPATTDGAASDAAKRTRTNAAVSVKEQVSDSTLVFVYPYGCSLNLESPAVPLLSSGFIAYPLQRPIAAVYEDRKSKGRVLVIGSSHMLHDDWIAKEENGKVCDVLFDYVLNRTKIQLNAIDAQSPQIEEHHLLPDTAALASRLRVCLEKPADVPRDFTELFETTPFTFHSDRLPDALKAFKELDIKHETLTLIHPQLEVPVPPLQPAVFGPALKEEPAPALDLFDLDEAFASERMKLATLTNKCSTEHLEYFIRECGEVLGVTKVLPTDRRADPRAILEHVLKHVMNFKKLNADSGADAFGAAAGGGGAKGGERTDGISFWDQEA